MGLVVAALGLAMMHENAAMTAPRNNPGLNEFFREPVSVSLVPSPLEFSPASWLPYHAEDRVATTEGRVGIFTASQLRNSRSFALLLLRDTSRMPRMGALAGTLTTTGRAAPTTLLLGLLALVAIAWVSILAQARGSLILDDARPVGDDLFARPANPRRHPSWLSHPTAPTVVASPPIPPAPEPTGWFLNATRASSDEEDEAPLYVRALGNGKYLSVSSRHSVRPAALDTDHPATHFQRVRVHATDGRTAWALRAVPSRTTTAGSRGNFLGASFLMTAGLDNGFPELMLVDEGSHWLAWELPAIVSGAPMPITLRSLNAVAGGGSAACLHYTLPQPLPGLHIDLREELRREDVLAAERPVANYSEGGRGGGGGGEEEGGSARPGGGGCVRGAPPASNAFAFEVGYVAVQQPRSMSQPVSLAGLHSSPTNHSYRSSRAAVGGGLGGGGLGGGASVRTPVHVALGVAVRTHEPTAPESLPLLSVLIPSLVETIERGGAFNYTLYIGYDRGDPTYDDPVLLAGVALALRRRLTGSPVRVIAVQYGGEDKGAPCWVWNKLFSRACSEGSSYFYQLNDDLKLVTPGWTPRFVDALVGSEPTNFGIAGPLDLNNERLMTQSFVSCVHLDILGFYYPWRFKNWYSDDWAAQLYGVERTYWFTDVEVDHSLTKGPRYTISYEHGAAVAPLVATSRRRLCDWLANHSQPSGRQLLEANYSACAADTLAVPTRSLAARQQRQRRLALDRRSQMRERSGRLALGVGVGVGGGSVAGAPPSSRNASAPELLRPELSRASMLPPAPPARGHSAGGSSSGMASPMVEPVPHPTPPGNASARSNALPTRLRRRLVGQQSKKRNASSTRVGTSDGGGAGLRGDEPVTAAAAAAAATAAGVDVARRRARPLPAVVRSNSSSGLTTSNRTTARRPSSLIQSSRSPIQSSSEAAERRQRHQRLLAEVAEWKLAKEPGL